MSVPDHTDDEAPATPDSPAGDTALLDEPDPWDEPAATTDADAPGPESTNVSVPDHTDDDADTTAEADDDADPAVEVEAPEPDEDVADQSPERPAAGQEAAARSEESAEPEEPEESAESEDQKPRPEGDRSAAKAAESFGGDAALLDEPDPWD